MHASTPKTPLHRGAQALAVRSRFSATAAASPPTSPEQIFTWLQDVSDPEIPVLSVVDLGVVREVRWDDDVCVVVITPTYSGCPAMREITQGIEYALRARGVARVQVRTRLAPAWTTDWMTDKGRAALQGYGIAAPVQCAADARVIDISALRRPTAEPAIACPHCGARHTRMISQFGSTACKALYRCMDCREPFDYFKPH